MINYYHFLQILIEKYAAIHYNKNESRGDDHARNTGREKTAGASA